VLVAVARGLSEAVGTRGTVGRLGGDELVVLLPSPAPGDTDLVREAILSPSTWWSSCRVPGCASL
jgi:GGDEF domain-containing protein